MWVKNEYLKTALSDWNKNASDYQYFTDTEIYIKPLSAPVIKRENDRGVIKV